MSISIRVPKGIEWFWRCESLKLSRSQATILAVNWWMLRTCTLYGDFIAAIAFPRSMFFFCIPSVAPCILTLIGKAIQCFGHFNLIWLGGRDLAAPLSTLKNFDHYLTTIWPRTLTTMHSYEVICIFIWNILKSYIIYTRSMFNMVISSHVAVFLVISIYPRSCQGP